jgi:hypothetical protein
MMKLVRNYKPSGKELSWEEHNFYMEVSDNMIFIYGGGAECCISPRVAQLMFNVLKKEGVVK